MIRQNSLSQKKYIFPLAYFLLWIILFEFILPANRILPKPTIVFESFGALWSDYNLPSNYLSTLSAVYLSMAVAYLVLFIFRKYFLIRKSFLSKFVLSLEWFSQYLPGILIGLVLIYWFPNSEYVEFIFAFFTAFFSLLIKMQNESKNINSAYVDSAKSLGINNSLINKNVKWNLITPSLLKHIINFHIYQWSMLLAFEYIKAGSGMGSLFRSAIEFKDISAIFSGFIIVGVTVYLGVLTLRFIQNRFYFWED